MLELSALGVHALSTCVVRMHTTTILESLVTYEAQRLRHSEIWRGDLWRSTQLASPGQSVLVVNSECWLGLSVLKTQLLEQCWRPLLVIAESK
jgi:hypothetical protein